MLKDFSMTLADRSWASADKDAIVVGFRTAQPFHFTPGQYVRVRLLGGAHQDAHGDARIFNVASSPAESDRVEIVTRLRGSAFKKNLLELPIGTEVSVSAPIGDFTLVDVVKAKHVFVIGGTGIAPILSMLHYLWDSGVRLDVSLLYSNKTVGRVVGADALGRWQRLGVLPHFVHTLTQTVGAVEGYESGRIDVEMISRAISQDDMKRSIFYISGPWGMGEAMHDVLRALDVPDERIHIKEFDLQWLQ